MNKHRFETTALTAAAGMQLAILVGTAGHLKAMPPAMRRPCGSFSQNLGFG